MASSSSKPVRCAIYTRKSTEEGLDQDFNSLDAQAEACAAYIMSQRHEGWAALPDIYEDGGYSGGNMDRPGLKALMAEVALGKVDVIVVYKVDRLTRSLADFAKIVDVLDKASASFVSVTQAFNTTTSMGRLTLNVLLSFAQFEREVTGERIRDKIAASKAKGMWMGGPVPLGYDVRDRKLVVNEAEATIVRLMFERYLALGSGRQLVVELEQRGIRSKARTNRHGHAYGSVPMTRGAIYAILQNRLYIGEVAHKGQIYPGQHDAIVDQQIFDNAQALLAQRRIDKHEGAGCADPSLLAGLLWDEHGRRMSPSHSCRGSRRYRYYVSQLDGEAACAHPAFRVSAPDIETRVMKLLSKQLDAALQALIESASAPASDIARIGARIAAVEEQLTSGTARDIRRHVLNLCERIEIGSEQIVVTLKLDGVDALLQPYLPAQAAIPIQSVRSGRQLKLILPPPASESDTRRDPALIKLVAQAMQARDTLATTQADNFGELAAAIGYGREHAADLLRVSWIAPDIIAAILGGRQPAGLTRRTLIKTPNLPLDWAGQRRILGFA